MNEGEFMMAQEKPKQIQAVELVRGLFEYIHGNLGLLRFSVDKLEPNNGHGEESDKWIVVCSFYKTLSSQQPTVYNAEVDLKENTVSFEAVKGDVAEDEKVKKSFKIVEDEEKDSKK